MGTELLPIPLSGGQGPAATLTGRGVAWRHRPGHVEQVAQRAKPLGRAAGFVQRHLAADAEIEGDGLRKHTL